MPRLSIIITSRFNLDDLEYADSPFYCGITVDQLPMAACVSLFRERGLDWPDGQLEVIAEQCGRHALTVDLAGGYVTHFGKGDRRTTLDLKFDSAQAPPFWDRGARYLHEQSVRFSKLAERYRTALAASEPLALLFLECVCLYRWGVSASELTDVVKGIYLRAEGSKRRRKERGLSRKKVRDLATDEVFGKLMLLADLRLVKLDRGIYYTHPAVRDGFLAHLDEPTIRTGHDVAAASGLSFLGARPSSDTRDQIAFLNKMETVIHHALDAGRLHVALTLYRNRDWLEKYRNLGWRLGEYARGDRICRAITEVAQRTEDYELTDDEKAVLHYERSQYLLALGELEDSLGYSSKCVRICNETGNANLESKAHSHTTGVLLLRGMIPRAYESNEHSFDCAANTMRNDLDAFADPSYNHGLSIRKKAFAFSAYAAMLEGSLVSALQDFRAALGYQRKVDSTGPHTKVWLRHFDRPVTDSATPLYSLRGVLQSLTLIRIGRFDAARSTAEENQRICAALADTNQHMFYPHSSLLLAELAAGRYDFGEAHKVLGRARDWAVARDAKEVLSWSALVQARIELTKLSAISGQQSAQKPEVSAGDESGNDADPSPALRACEDAITEGLKIARDCGYGLYHIDLLVERARLHLFRGDPQHALEDLRLALDDGIPANGQTGQPELLAANHEECGYAWPIPAGLQLRAEAKLLQAAQQISSDSFVPAKISELPKDVAQLIDQAKQHLHEALERWQPLHDPEPERPDQNFKLDGKEYNYRAADTHQVLVQLEGGILTQYSLSPVETAPTESKSKQPTTEEDMSRRFNVALSFPGEHRAYVEEMANALAGTLTKEKVFYDRFYEAELSRPNLDTYLQEIYHDHSELVVVVLCKEYDEKEWCGLEFRAIRDLIKKRRDDEIMFVRVADGDVKGVFGIDGYVDAQDRPASDIAEVICDRLKLVQAANP